MARAEESVEIQPGLSLPSAGRESTLRQRLGRAEDDRGEDGAAQRGALAQQRQGALGFRRSPARLELGRGVLAYLFVCLLQAFGGHALDRTAAQERLRGLLQRWQLHRQTGLLLFAFERDGNVRMREVRLRRGRLSDDGPGRGRQRRRRGHDEGRRGHRWRRRSGLFPLEQAAKLLLPIRGGRVLRWRNTPGAWRSWPGRQWRIAIFLFRLWLAVFFLPPTVQAGEDGDDHEDDQVIEAGCQYELRVQSGKRGWEFKVRRGTLAVEAWSFFGA